MTPADFDRAETIVREIVADADRTHRSGIDPDVRSNPAYVYLVYLMRRGVDPEVPLYLLAERARDGSIPSPETATRALRLVKRESPEPLSSELARTREASYRARYGTAGLRPSDYWGATP